MNVDFIIVHVKIDHEFVQGIRYIYPFTLSINCSILKKCEIRYSNGVVVYIKESFIQNTNINTLHVLTASWVFPYSFVKFIYIYK